MTKEKDINELQIVFDTSADNQETADAAISDPAILNALIEALSGDDRRVRQYSASTIRTISRTNPELLLDHLDDIADALHRPEAQTRWEALEVMVHMAVADPEAAARAFEGAEDALYDEDSGSVRVAAFEYFTAFGATSSERSDQVWPLLDDAIQCYHGDPEFGEMLNFLRRFVEGDISKETIAGIKERLAFDAEGGKGYIQKQARAILAYLEEAGK